MTLIFLSRIIKITVLGILFLIGCSKSPTDSQSQTILFDIDARLPQDSNGYYHLQLNSYNWQTLHRISGSIFSDNEPAENAKFHWTSSHYWILGDSVGYIIDVWNCYNSGCEEPWEAPAYVGLDTLYMTYFSGMEVPTINSASYSGSDGEVNTMFAPVWSMKGDTVTVTARFWDEYNNSGDIKSLSIVLG